jgi:DNA repair protein endonuclease SAE2/CtIP C-terminus
MEMNTTAENSTEYKSSRLLFSSSGTIIKSRYKKRPENAIKLRLVIAGPPAEKSNRLAANSWKVKSIHTTESKTKGPVVLKKSERSLLNGYECVECMAYYKTFELSPKKLEERLRKCSRHRALNTPPTTPEGFWEIGFPQTPE